MILDWTLFIAAFSCFFIAGISAMIAFFPISNESAVEKRLFELSQKFADSVIDRPVKASQDAVWMRYLKQKVQSTKQFINFYWQPFYQHLTALQGEKESKNLALKLCFQLILCLITFLIIFSAFSWLQQFFAAITITALMAYLYYRYRSQQQIKAYEEQLPSIIEHLARAVSTGLSVPQGLASCAQSSRQPARFELNRLSQQLSLGLTLEHALAEAQIRIPVREFNFLAAILILNQQTGGRLSEALNNLATSLRDRKAMRLKLSSLTSEPRAAATIVSLFPPLTLLGLWQFNPTQWHFLWNDESGQSVLIYAGSSIILGLLIIHRLARGSIS